MRKKLLGLGLVLVGTLAIACDPPAPQADQPEERGEVPDGGVLTIAGARRLDSLDPAAMYASTSLFLARGLYRTLVTFPPGSGSGDSESVVADLATDTGTPNEDATQWHFTLKAGIRFGPGIGGTDIEGVTGSEITAYDIKYGIERLFLDSVEAGYPFHFDIIDGIEEFVLGRADGINGIEVPDEKTVIFHLRRPAGDWPLRLAMPAASPVPKEYASQFDQALQSNYNSHAVSSGPYFVKEWVQDERIELDRNPHWDSTTDGVRKAHVDGLRWEFGYERTLESTAKAVGQDIHLVHGAGQDGVSFDPGFVQQVVRGEPVCTRYIWLNTRVVPFDQPLVRKAVAFSINRSRLVQLRGGPSISEIATSLLPPGIDGYVPPDEFDPFKSKGMRGDLTKAKTLLEKAGLTGKFAQRIRLVAGDSDEEKRIGASVTEDLRALGFENIKMKHVSIPDLFTEYYGDPDSDVAVGTSGGWCRDYNDPAAFLMPLLGRDAPTSDSSFNYSRLDDSRLNRALRTAQETLLGSQRRAAWEQVNRLATTSAALIPWGWDVEEIVFNETLVNALYNPWLAQIDWVVAGVRR